MDTFFFFSKRKVQKVTEFVWLICTTDETLFTFQGSGCEKNHISQTHAPCTPLSMVRIMKVLEPLKNCVKTLHGLLQMYRETNIIIGNTIIDNINTLRVYFSVKNYQEYCEYSMLAFLISSCNTWARQAPFLGLAELSQSSLDQFSPYFIFFV